MNIGTEKGNHRPESNKRTGIQVTYYLNALKCSFSSQVLKSIKQRPSLPITSMHNSLKISLILAFPFYPLSKPLRENRNRENYIQKDCETLLLILLTCAFRTTSSFSYGL